MDFVLYNIFIPFVCYSIYALDVAHVKYNYLISSEHIDISLSGMLELDNMFEF